MLHPSSTTAELTLTSDHKVIILNRGSMFAFQWREVYPSLSRVTLRCDVAHSGRENLHQFLSILLWRHALSSSIMTLWLCSVARAVRISSESNCWHSMNVLYPSSLSSFQLFPLLRGRECQPGLIAVAWDPPCGSHASQFDYNNNNDDTSWTTSK